MKRMILPALLLFTSIFSIGVNKAVAQLVNDGALITIGSGATIFCAGNVENKNGGIITNNGTLEVQGNFKNTAIYNSTMANDQLLLSGGGNVTLEGGASTFTKLRVNKTAAGNEVKLVNTTFLLTGQLDYDQGNFTTDPLINPALIFSAPTSAVFNFAAGKEIVGKVRRTGWVNAPTVAFNQPNMQLRTTGGTAPGDLTVTMIPQSAGGDPSLAEREVKRKFQFAHTGGTGFATDIRFPYLDTELNVNNEAGLFPWQLIAGVWTPRLTPVTKDGVANFVATTGLLNTELTNEWKLAAATDLTLSSRVSSTGFAEASQTENTIVLDVSEIIGGTTDNALAPVQVRIFKSDNFTYSFDPLQVAANAPGPITVHNPDWNLTTNSSTVMVFTLKPGININGGSFSSIAVKVKVVQGASKGTSNFNVTIIGGSGNEVDITNNQVVRVLNIF